MLLLLNGPPQVGKTTIKDMLVEMGAHQIVLNRPFVRFVQEALDINDDEMRAGKDRPLAEHGFQAPIRDALIAAADAVELVDPAVWVRCALQDKPLTKGQVYVLDSLGKQAQYDWILDYIDHPHVVLRPFRHLDDLKEPVYSDGRERVQAPPGHVQATCDVPNMTNLSALREVVAELYGWASK